MQITDELHDWDDIRKRYEGGGLLIGNGASLAVWDNFSYGSLYENASLEMADKDVFSASGTTNFELVLDALRLGEVVCKAVGHNPDDVRNRYLSVRYALFESVRSVHVPWDSVPEEVLAKIGRELRRYDMIFSTNYDLLVYWSIMHGSSANIRDYFWNPDLSFDPTNTEVIGSASTILYLHGGIHLYVDSRTETTIKRRPLSGGLLDFSDLRSRNRRPLFVSEGRSTEKMRSIRRSDYLSFGYQSLVDHEGSLVIFGHSLSDADEHIIKAIRSGNSTRIAVGLLPGRARRVIASKTRISEALSGKRVRYFDSTTHPLGEALLKVPSTLW
jgi:hypothetical protein